MKYNADRHREYRKKHPEYVLRQKQITKKWISEHKDYMKAHNKKWYVEHKDIARERNKRWCLAHKKQRAEHSKRYYADNREKCLEHQRKDRKNHKEYYQQYEKKRSKLYLRKEQRRHNNLRRRMRKNNIQGFHTIGEWELLKKQYGYNCPSCNRKEPTIKLSEDHIIPIVKGGSNDIENIQPLCISCNCKKHTKTIKFQLK